MWFVWLPLIVILVLAGYFVLTIILKVWMSKKNLEFYKEQGLLTYYDAKLGVHAMYTKSHAENLKESNVEYVKKIANDWKGVKALAANNLENSSISVYLFDSDLIKEFLLNEDQFIKGNIMKRNKHNRFGIFFENGEKLFRSKALFTKIFTYEGMESFTPEICKIAQDCFSQFSAKHGITKGSFTKANVEELFHPIMKRIANLVIFGAQTFSENSEEEELFTVHEKLFATMRKVHSNPFFILAPQLMSKLGLVKEINELDELSTRQEEIVASRLDSWQSKTNLGNCVIDRIVQHNRKCKEEGNTVDIMNVGEITGTINTFIFAGTDTSQNSTKMALCHMADKPELQKIIEDINKEIYDSEGITHTSVLDKCELLNLWIKEALRIYNPIGAMSNRLATKDTKIGNITIRKGDHINILYSALNFKEDIFKEAKQFRLDRFDKTNEKNIPKYHYLPFSVGKRVCLGRHLGELMVKLLATQFMRTYNISKPDDVEYYTVFSSILRVRNPILNLSLK